MKKQVIGLILGLLLLLPTKAQAEDISDVMPGVQIGDSLDHVQQELKKQGLHIQHSRDEQWVLSTGTRKYGDTKWFPRFMVDPESNRLIAVITNLEDMDEFDAYCKELVHRYGKPHELSQDISPPYDRLPFPQWTVSDKLQITMTAMPSDNPKCPLRILVIYKLPHRGD